MVIVWWIIGIVALAAALKLVIVWAEPYMAFVPRRCTTPPPQGFDRITLTVKDGTRLSGWTTLRNTEGPLFLYFCGNAGNLSDREEMLSQCAASGMSMVAFDYRGTGESEGRATESKVYRDAEEIYDFVVSAQAIDPARIILWGHSIGGAVAAELANRRQVAGIVVEGTFRSGLIMAKRMLPFLPVSWLMTYKFDNEANIRRLQCPILLIHGSRDYTIPAADSEYLFKLATSDKELWIVDGADHNDVYVVAGYSFANRLIQFGQRVAKTPVRLH